MKIKDITQALEEVMPLWMQESYDNCGLQVGDKEAEVSSALLCVDLTEAVVQEAIDIGAKLIITHHPPLFKGLKQITGRTYIERSIIKAIQNDIAIYAAHTNADNAPNGLNYILAEDFGLRDIKPISPLEGKLMELVTFVPNSHLEVVQKALWSAGAGQIGAYDSCSYSSNGVGTFRPLEGANPFSGEQGELAKEEEQRLSVILASANASSVLGALHSAHPYEVPAYSLIPLANAYLGAGAGIIGDLEEAIETESFLRQVKEYFACEKLSYSKSDVKKIKRVAICGGSGAFLWRAAKGLGADIFITGEAKYNDYFDIESQPILATVGHYESEVIATKLFYKVISKKFPNFVLHKSKLNSNPIISI